MKRLFLIDAYALIFRYYYAFMGRPMRNREGFNTSVVFGFTKFLRDILKREKPDLIGVAFDPPGGSFRRTIYPEYKANRAETPEDIISSVPYVKRIVEAMNIPILEVAGYEADDVIGTLSKRGTDAGYEVFMVTPDKDYGQLVSDNCKIYKQKDNAVEIIDREAIRAKYGIDDPTLIRDILALWGDASDNIPGVPGVGEKSACKLVQAWGTVENIIENVGQIKGKQGEKIAASVGFLPLSKTLTTICLDTPVELDEKALEVSEPNRDALREIFIEMNFMALMSDFGISVIEAPATSPSAPTPTPTKASKAISSPNKLKSASLEGQGDLFAMVAHSEPEKEPEKEIEKESENATMLSLFGEGEIEVVKTATSTPHKYTMLTTVDDVKELVTMILKQREFCFDTETTGLDFLQDKIVGISISTKPHEAYYIPFKDEYTEVLRPIFESESIDKIGQNIKFDLMMMRSIGIDVRGRLIDTMLLDYLLDAEARHNMNSMALRLLNYKPIEIETLIGKGAKQLTMDMVSPVAVCEYAAEDADITMQLKEKLYPQIVEQGMESLYFTIEEPMIRVLADMEWAGVTIDQPALAKYAETLNERMAILYDSIRREAGEATLNVNSPKQLGEVLFGKMKIADKPKLTKTKQYCTDEEYLQSFAKKHPIVDMILEYRGVKKLLSTYVEALPQLVNARSGHIHSSYNQAVTATGRLSSTNPNLQNIPIRDELGRPIREAFIPSSVERLLLSADYSQVELRLMAHLSGDESLIEAFANGEDIHSATAAKLYQKSIDEVTSDERRKAKTANFGIIYGISAFGLSQRLDIARGEAKEIIDGYFASYPAVKEYMDRAIEGARESGYVTTLFGRRRYLRDITSRNAVARGVAERNAINAPIQGSAADIMKLAMINIWRRFKAEGVKSQMIMQVHDEVVVDMVRCEEDQVRRIVSQEMERAADLKVRLLAECGVGENWLKAH
ncbi:MAG: DNA polymerase I [Rikenellaceae bacterium]